MTGPSAEQPMTEEEVQIEPPQFEIKENNLQETTNSVKETAQDTNAENEDLPDRKRIEQNLNNFEIDLEKDADKLQEVQKMGEKAGIVEILDDTNLDDTQKAEQIEQNLIEAEDDPKLGLEKFNAIAQLALEKFGDWAAEATAETLKSGMLRLLKALFEGANYNSGSSLRNYEKEKPNDIVSSKDFFLQMREKPQESIKKILDNSSELKAAGWEIGKNGLELLKKGKDDPNFAKEALMAVLIGSQQDGITSLSEHLTSVDDNERWKNVGAILAQELFDNKKMLSLTIKKDFKNMHEKKQEPQSRDYFGT